MEGKKFLFLSSMQRWSVSIVLLALVFGATAAIALGAQHSQYAKLVDVSAETLKLALTASAGWVLVLLYASANSSRRIERETRRFLDVDLVRPTLTPAFLRSTVALFDGEAPLTMQRLHATRTSATYRVSDGAGRAMHFWCDLNVYDLAVVFMLPGEVAPLYERVFEPTLAGFKRRGIEVQSFGLVTHRFDDPPAPRQYLELYMTRTLPEDFLFNAASRFHAAQALAGDLTSFIGCLRRAEQDLQQ